MKLIEAQDITKTFHVGEQDITVLHGINFVIEKGEFVAITGKSGSGKSTLMNIIGCLDVPTSGHYLFEGMDVGSKTPDELAHIRNQKIGFIFQRFNLLTDLPALDNVMQPQLFANVSEKEARERAKHLLELVDLGDRLYHYPYQLSGGQQQRVAIARSMANNPEVILADEPTGNLDTKTGERVIDAFMKLNDEGKITLIVITHDLDIAQKARRIITLSDGRIENDIRD